MSAPITGLSDSSLAKISFINFLSGQVRTDRAQGWAGITEGKGCWTERAGAHQTDHFDQF